MRRNQVCLLGMKQIVCNCRALSNVWACCRGTDDLCAEQTQEDANCFKVAERAIELCTLPPMWCRELFEYCTESGFEELLQRQANGAPLMGSSIPIEISPEDIAAFRLLHSRGIFDIMATVNRNGQLWQDK